MQYIRTIFFYFIIYSFLGWIIEGLFSLFTKGHFLKANFLILPLKPMYGVAATLLIILKNLVPLWIFLIITFILPSVVEYISAYLLLHLFHLRYWDYSHCSYQLSGYICLKFSIYWFFLSLLLIYGLQPFIIALYHSLNWFWGYFFPISLLIFLIDFCLSVYNKKHTIIKPS